MDKPEPSGPSDVAIRLVAVEAAARHLGQRPPPGPGQDDVPKASNDIVTCADQIAAWIRTGKHPWLRH